MVVAQNMLAACADTNPYFPPLPINTLIVSPNVCEGRRRAIVGLITSTTVTSVIPVAINIIPRAILARFPPLILRIKTPIITGITHKSSFVIVTKNRSKID